MKNEYLKRRANNLQHSLTKLLDNHVKIDNSKHGVGLKLHGNVNNSKIISNPTPFSIEIGHRNYELNSLLNYLPFLLEKSPPSFKYSLIDIHGNHIHYD